MFEKDAEKIANEKLCATAMCYNHCNFNSPKHHRCGEWHRCYEIAKDSAEFGYNKANEWHKEDLRPRTLGYYLTASKHKSYKGFVFEVAYFTGTVFIKDGQIGDNVIAWKEILPPKESE